MTSQINRPHFDASGHLSPERPKLLMSAYACCPDRGSEPGVGWNRAFLAAQDFDTWVITEDADYGAVIRQYLKSHGPVDGLQFVYVPKSRLVRLLRYGLRLYYPALRLWHRDAYRVAQQLHDEIGFDAVHQVNFMTFREPGYLWKLDAPFIWGPWGGVQNYPWRFLPMAGPLAAMREGLRSIINVIQLRFNRRVQTAARRAELLLACNSENQEAFARVHGIKPKVLAGNGVAALLADSPKRPRSSAIKLLWVGRLEGFKGLPLLLKALARLSGALRWELQVIGKGPKLKQWQRLTARLGIADQVSWNYLATKDVYSEYRKSDIFVFTSMRESIPTVVIEAMSAGLPIIYLDHHGMRDMVPRDAGIGIAVRTPKQVINDLAESITALFDDPSARERMSMAALEQAEKYLWSNQGKQLNGLILQVIKPKKAAAPSPTAFASV
jgi:glycosyltransferase involved in cell wall biosynthesis